MPTVRALRRKKRQPQPDPDKPPSYVLISTATPAPPPDPEMLPLSYDRKGRAEGLRYAREKLYAWAMASRFGEWLVLLAARERVPMDDCCQAIERLTLYVEAFLLASATWPYLYPMQFVDDDDVPTDYVPRTATEAVAAGLTVDYRRHEPRQRPVATLPGCHGTPHGGPCNNLRRFGEKFCPSCRRRELQRMRDGVTR